MRKLFYAFIFIGALTFIGCSSLPQMIKLAKEQKLEVTPNPLEVHKDTVVFKLSANLPLKMLKKGTVYTLNTFYKYDQNEIAFAPIVFKASDYPTASTEQPKITKTFTFPYVDAQKTGTVEIQGVAAQGTKTKSTERLPIATGVITTSKLVQKSYSGSFADPGVVTTSRLVEKSYSGAFADHGYNYKEEIVPVVIPDFYFERGKSELRKSELKSSKATQLDAFIAAKNVTRTVTITGTHSPEGLERINSKLSEERAAVIEKYYRAQMKKYDYKGQADEIKFILKPIVDSWAEFKVALAAYAGISSDEKTSYLDIVNSPSSFENQENQLKKLKSYAKVFKDIYPTLRAAKTEILTIKKKRTDSEISVLAKQVTKGEVKTDSVSVEELMYAASLTPSLEEKASIYQSATKKGAYWNAHNNLGATYISMALENPANAKDYTDKAAAQFEIAAKIKETPEVLANLASVTLWKGNPYKTIAIAKKALNGASSDLARGINGTKAAAEIMIADYDAAVRSASAASETNVNLFNKGLAQILTKDFANASTSFADAIKKNPNYAIAYYGAAVAAAKAGQGDNVVSSLSKAVKIDPSLKDKALTDLEFSKFVTTDAFRNALK